MKRELRKVALNTVSCSDASGDRVVLPGVAALLPTSMQNAINPYLPSVVAGTIMSGNHDAHTFSAWGGFALFCGHTDAISAAVIVLLVVPELLARRGH